MLIEVKRIYKKEDYTIGKMYIDVEYFCDTLEDTDRGLKQEYSLAELKEMKEYGKTAIPTGEYIVTITYSNRFKKMMPLINDVPAFSGVRMHPLNTSKETDGCIGVGICDDPNKDWIRDSRKNYNELMRILEYRLDTMHEEVRIKVESNDRV